VSVQQSLLGEHLLLRVMLHLAGSRDLPKLAQQALKHALSAVPYLRFMLMIVCNSVGSTASVLHTFACTVSMHVLALCLARSGYRMLRIAVNTVSACLYYSLKACALMSSQQVLR
jgi:hypothetical protein